MNGTHKRECDAHNVKCHKGNANVTWSLIIPWYSDPVTNSIRWDCHGTEMHDALGSGSIFLINFSHWDF